MTPTEVYLDMDGVLVDFTPAALHLHGLSKVMHVWPLGVYDLPKVANMEPADFWAPVIAQPSEWWATLPPTKYAHELPRLLDCWPITIASKPTGPNCRPGKIEWLARQYGRPRGPIPYEFPDDKAEALLGPVPPAERPGCLLIDDSDAEVDAWRARGGSAILFPTVWNSAWKWATDPVGHVQRTLTE